MRIISNLTRARTDKPRQKNKRISSANVVASLYGELISIWTSNRIHVDDKIIKKKERRKCFESKNFGIESFRRCEKREKIRRLRCAKWNATKRCDNWIELNPTQRERNAMNSIFSFAPFQVVSSKICDEKNNERNEERNNSECARATMYFSFSFCSIFIVEIKTYLELIIISVGVARSFGLLSAEK